MVGDFRRYIISVAVIFVLIALSGKTVVTLLFLSSDTAIASKVFVEQVTKRYKILRLVVRKS
jgi:hypothetical protein